MAKEGDAPQQEPRRLTINDPVSPEERARLNELELAREGIARRFLDLELEKVRLLGAAKRAENEARDVYQKILVDRGLPPDMVVEVNFKTGQIRSVHTQDGPPGPVEPTHEEAPPPEEAPEG